MYTIEHVVYATANSKFNNSFIDSIESFMGCEMGSNISSDGSFTHPMADCLIRRKQRSRGSMNFSGYVPLNWRSFVLIQA